MQLGGAILNITYARPMDFPGVNATIDEIAEVNVAIPTNHRDAEKLFRQGNRVRAIGQLDCRMEFQGGDSVKTKLAEIDAEWHTHKQELLSKPGELRRAETTYRRLRQRFEAAPRLYVLLGHVELLEGEPIALADTYEQRRAFVRMQRAQREARPERVSTDRACRAGGTGQRADGGAQAPEPAQIAAQESETAEATTAIHTGRPRRRATALDTAELAIITVPTADADAMPVDSISPYSTTR